MSLALISLAWLIVDTTLIMLGVIVIVSEDDGRADCGNGNAVVCIDDSELKLYRSSSHGTTSTSTGSCRRMTGVVGRCHYFHRHLMSTRAASTSPSRAPRHFLSACTQSDTNMILLQLFFCCLLVDGRRELSVAGPACGT